MKYDNFIKISEFAKLGGMSRKMLIHYDKVGVLKPEYQDPDTKYRYYSIQQIKTLKMINTLQFLGVSLSEIKKDYIETSIEKYTENLKREKKIIDKKFLEIQISKKLIENQLTCLEEISNLNIEENFKVKKIPKRYMISTPIKKTSMGEYSKILLPLEKKVTGRGFLLFGELALIRDSLEEISPSPKFLMGIFNEKDIETKDTTSFEFGPGDYLSFYKEGTFLEEENTDFLNSYFEESIKYARVWCKKNNYEIESNILVIPLLLPFFKLNNKIFEVQVKIKKLI